MKANYQISFLKIIGLSILIAAGPLWSIVPGACAEGFPAAGWHRGGTSQQPRRILLKLFIKR
jgi:hypothetical protein